MKIAIIDDSLSDTHTLCTYITQYSSEHKAHIQIDSFENGLSFLRVLEHSEFDILFLDIFLNHPINGMQIAQKVRHKYPHSQIVFSTASTDYAIKAFRINALDYLVKPISYEHFSEAMGKCSKALMKFSHYIELKEGRHFTKVLIDNILYVDYHNHYIQVHLNNQVIRSYMPFSELAEMLQPYNQFLWCYRNCMVNMDKIETSDSKDFTLSNNEKIPISRAQKSEVLQQYANYVFHYIDKNIRHS